MPRKGRLVKKDIRDEHSKVERLQPKSPEKRRLRSSALSEVKQSELSIGKPQNEQRRKKEKGVDPSTADTSTKSQHKSPAKRNLRSKALPKVNQSDDKRKESISKRSKHGGLSEKPEKKMAVRDSGNSMKTEGFESNLESVGLESKVKEAGFGSKAESTSSDSKMSRIGRISKNVTKIGMIKKRKEVVKCLDKIVAASGTSPEQLHSKMHDEGEDHLINSTFTVETVLDLSRQQQPKQSEPYYFPCYHSDDETMNRFTKKTSDELDVKKHEQTKPQVKGGGVQGQTGSGQNAAWEKKLLLSVDCQDLFSSKPGTSNADGIKMPKVKKELEDVSSLPVGRKRRILKREIKHNTDDLGSVENDINESSPKKKSRIKAKIDKKENVKARPPTKKKVPIADLELKKRMLKNTQTRKNKYIGAHVSISGSLCNAISDAVLLGARAFGMFLKSQRQWSSKPLDKQDAEIFRTFLKEYQFSPAMVVPHGSYLMNCGSPVSETLTKSRAMLVDELKRCEMLGLDIFNFHPGSSCGKISAEESVDLIAESINMALSQTKHVTAVIENMSCQGHTIGGKFSELAAIIERVKDKSRVGVCLDTCHMFAAGYNIKTADGYEKVMKEFDEVVGFKYLKAVHLNDSKGPLGCHRDLHATIGNGRIGVPAFQRLMNDQRFDNIPMILETPQIDYSKEIKLLNKLIEP